MGGSVDCEEWNDKTYGERNAGGKMSGRKRMLLRRNAINVRAKARAQWNRIHSKDV